MKLKSDIWQIRLSFVESFEFIIKFHFIRFCIRKSIENKGVFEIATEGFIVYITRERFEIFGFLYYYVFIANVCTKLNGLVLASDSKSKVILGFPINTLFTILTLPKPNIISVNCEIFNLREFKVKTVNCNLLKLFPD